MATIMLYWFHEEPFSEFDSFWGEERTPSSIGGRNPWGLGRDKDCRLAFGFRGAASRMDNGSLGSNEDEFESLDPCGEPRGFAGITTEAEARQAHWLRGEDAKDHCGAPREVAAGLRVKSSTVGWADFGDPLKAALGDNPKGKAGSEVDASPRLSAEAGRLYLSTGES